MAIEKDKQESACIVRMARAKLGLGQDEFAGKFSVTPQTVMNWEKGRTSPSARKWKLIMELYLHGQCEIEKKKPKPKYQKKKKTKKKEKKR
jgi:DNA-binding transcriptional regulator YiaG